MSIFKDLWDLSPPVLSCVLHSSSLLDITFGMVCPITGSVIFSVG